MANRSLADVVADIRSKLDRGDDYDADIRRAIRNQIDLLKGRRYGFNVVREGLTLDAEYVTLPAHVIEIDRLTVDFSSYRDKLEEQNPAFINDENDDPDFDGRPVYYSRERNGETMEVRLSPPPDQTYSAQMVFLADMVKRASLSISWSDSTSGIGWFDDGFLIVKYAALAELSADVIGGPEGREAARQFAQQLVVAEKELADRAGLEAHSGRIKPCM